MDSKRTFFFISSTDNTTGSAQINTGVTPTCTQSNTYTHQSVEEHGYTHLEYAGGTGITFISGYWNKRNGGGPFPQIITRQAEKPVNDNTGIPNMGPTHAGQGTLGWSVTSLTPNGRAG